MDKYTENSLLRAEIEQLKHQRELLGQTLGEALVAAGIIRADAYLDGPQLLMFGEDLINWLKSLPRD